ncbi:uncharacterized protein PHA67_024406 [Liasis olivaceus]
MGKVPPATDPPVKSMLLNILVFLWMGTMETKDEDVLEVPPSSTCLGLAFWLWGLFSCFSFFGRKKRNAKTTSNPGAGAESSPVRTTSKLEDTTKAPEGRKIKFYIGTDLEKEERCDFPTKNISGTRKLLFTKKDPQQARKAQREAACVRSDLRASQSLWQKVYQRNSKAAVKQEDSIIQCLCSIAALFQLKQSGALEVQVPRNKNLYSLAVLALLEDNQLSSFSAGLAALLAVYDISKVPPAMDPPVESMLLKIFVFLWMGSMERKDEDVPEEEKKLLEEALGITLRGLLRQAPTSEHFIFILKHFQPHGWRCFSSILNQLLYCGNHHPRINLTKVQQAFPQVPAEAWHAGKHYGFINEDDLAVEEL